MQKSNAIEQDAESRGKGKIILTIFLIFVLVPVSILGMLYFTNDNFRFMANDYLRKIPGPIGQYFDKFPTKEEREAEIDEVVQYLLNIDVENASDKLIIIQKEDKDLYTELTKRMMQVNIQRTSKILESIRQRSIKKDALTSTVAQIKKDKTKEIQERARYYESLSVFSAVNEINMSLMNDETSYKELGRILQQVNERKAAQILYNLDEQVSKNILAYYEFKDKEKTINELINKLKDRENQLIHMAQIYNFEDPEKLIKEIGNDQKYKFDELSIIYRNIDRLQAAKVLAKVEDENFICNLLQQVKTDEILSNGDERLSLDIVDAVRIYREYNDKIDKLAKAYQKMETEQLGKVLLPLFKGKNNLHHYALENGDTITISDQDIAVDILKKLQPKTVAEVLTTLDNSLASEISKKLTLPH